jgi:LuxR family transcriptional regulator, maltose regulon positive regulatory protein
MPPSPEAGARRIAAVPPRSADRSRGPATGPPFELLESKLSPPRSSVGAVKRQTIVDRLNRSEHRPIVVVGAGPGYGKTTALSQWSASEDARLVAWLSIDAHDNDPVVLLTYIAAALDRISPIDPAVFRVLGSAGASIEAKVVPRLARSLEKLEEPIHLVLDDFHLIDNPTCIDAVVALTGHLAPRSRIVVSTRDQSVLPLGRWRTRDLLLELGPGELRMNEREAKGLFEAAAVESSDAEIKELVSRTEGWPAGLYLAALSAEARESGDSPVGLLTGNDPLVVEFLHSEFLANLPDDDADFLLEASLLEQMSGPLCDAALARTGSAEALETLAGSNRFVVGLDRERNWYRCHHLLRELLAVEVARSRPELTSAIRRRAFDWCFANGREIEAVRYAQADGDVDRVAAAVTGSAQATFQSGRTATVELWFDWLHTHAADQNYPAAAVVAAVFYAVRGQASESDRWAAAAEQGEDPVAPLPDGSPSIDSWRALVRALRCRDGAEAMHADATLAVETLALGSRWRPPALLVLGLAESVSGSAHRANDLFVDAAEEAKVVADATGTPVVVPLALAEQSIVAMAQDEWVRANTLAEQALWEARRSHDEEAALHGLSYAVAARTAMHRDQASDARELLTQAQRRLPWLTYACPIPSVQTRLEMARTYLELADQPGARTVLGEIDAMLRRFPDLGALGEDAAELRSRLASPGHGVRGASALTAAELRVVPLLTTHLSYREIGDRLYLSKHTVKSHAMSIYSKLGVSSRSEGVERAREVGLL